MLGWPKLERHPYRMVPLTSREESAEEPEEQKPEHPELKPLPVAKATKAVLHARRNRGNWHTAQAEHTQKGRFHHSGSHATSDRDTFG